MSNKNEKNKKPVEKIHEFLAGELFTIKIEGEVVLDENLGDILAEILDEAPWYLKKWINYSYEANSALLNEEELDQETLAFVQKLTQLLHHINALGKRVHVDFDKDGMPAKVVRE